MSPGWRNAAMRRTAVRETGVSRHQGGQLGGTPETPRISRHCGIEGFKEGLNWPPETPVPSTAKIVRKMFLI